MSRLQLRSLIKETLGDVPTYFQAPPNTGMKYPCVLYTLDDVDVQHADNHGFILTDRYLLTVIESDPDAQIWRGLLRLRGASFVRAYPAEQLYHTLINLQL